MAKAKVKVSVKKGRSGTKLASGTIRVARDARPAGKPLYQTRAQMNIHIRSGQRTSEFRYRGTR